MDQARLIETLDAHVQSGDVTTVTSRIQQFLAELGRSGTLELPDELCRPGEQCYARRLLHRDRQLGYTAVLMTWGPGQQTPLHDHAGIWCVEGVLQGEMTVTRYEVRETEGDRYRFDVVEEVRAAVGSSGSLIPPFEYHVLGNALADRTSLTLHVYGGEMDRCGCFQPSENGWYQRFEKSLDYDD